MIPPWRQANAGSARCGRSCTPGSRPLRRACSRSAAGTDGRVRPGASAERLRGRRDRPRRARRDRLPAHRLRALRAAAARRRDRRQPLAAPRARHRRRARPGAAALRPGGAIVVLEWAWERFDEPTARWCFARLDPPRTGGRLAAAASRRVAGLGRGVARVLPGLGERSTACSRSDRILAGLDARFERTLCDYAPYFFADLADGLRAGRAGGDRRRRDPRDRHPLRRQLRR